MFLSFLTPWVSRSVIRKHLSPEEVEELISVYIERFVPEPEKKVPLGFGGFPQKIGSLVGMLKAQGIDAEGPGRARDLQGTEMPSGNDQTVERYTSVAITITGDSLHFALSNEEARKYFFGLAHLCSTVCWRFGLLLT